MNHSFQTSPNSDILTILSFFCYNCTTFAQCVSSILIFETGAATSRAEALAKRAVSLKKETKIKNDDDDEEDQEEEDEIEIDATLEPDLYCHLCYEDTHTHGKRSHHR